MCSLTRMCALGWQAEDAMVTDVHAPSPELRFKYVFIPADLAQPMEEV
jgi:hypothetical protein